MISYIIDNVIWTYVINILVFNNVINYYVFSRNCMLTSISLLVIFSCFHGLKDYLTEVLSLF